MSCPPQLWDGVVCRLGADLPAFTLEAWVRPLVAEEDAGHLRLVCPTQFHLDRVRRRFLERIAGSAADLAGRPIEVELVVRDRPPRAPRSEAGAVETAVEKPRFAPLRTCEPPHPPGEGGVVPRASARLSRRPLQASFPHSFDNFVVGPCNALAREASVAVARGAHATLKLLYLKSETGLGKTHLARAIVSEARRHVAGRVLYASAEAFTNDFMKSLRRRRMDQFKRHYRERCDLLVVEDVQFLGSKASTQLEFFHTVTHLLDVGARVVLTGACLPRSIAGIDSRMSSQMTSGLIAELETPNAEVRRRILRSKAAGGGVGLPDDCLNLLVERVRGSVRDLEGVLIQLVSTASLLKRPIDLELTEAALRKVSDPQPRERRLSCKVVMEVVASFFKTDPETLVSRSRRRDVLLPRQLAMYLCRRYTDEPVAAIARAFGRNHPAVANAERVIARDMLERAPLRYQIEALSERLDQLERDAGSHPSPPVSSRHR